MTVLRTLKLVLLAAMSFVQSCSHPVSDQMDPNPAGPGIEQLRNATYSGLEAQPIRLRDGRFDGEPFVPGGSSRLQIAIHDEIAVFADLDGDGANEAIVPLVKQAGGSGTWTYLAVMGTDARNLATVLLGDRAQLIELSTSGARIHAELIEHGPNDGMCCPTQRVEREWELTNGRLEAAEPIEVGPISVQILTDTAWRLTSLTGIEIADSETLLDAVIETDRISGSSGCNRYFASIQSSGPGQISLGPIAGTARECAAPTMNLESQFLEGLQDVDRFGFFMGKLLLTGTGTQESTVNLTFSRSAPTENP